MLKVAKWGPRDRSPEPEVVTLWKGLLELQQSADDFALVVWDDRFVSDRLPGVNGKDLCPWNAANGMSHCARGCSGVADT